MNILSNELFWAILGFLITAFALYKQFYAKPNEEVKHLAWQFKETQRVSIEMQEILKKLILDHNASNTIMAEHVTYGKYLEMTQKNYCETLFDASLKQLMRSKLSKERIASHTKSLETQFQNLQSVKLTLESLS